MKKEDITINPDGTIQCVMVLGNNPCVVQVVPTEKTDLMSLRKMLDENNINQKNFYIIRNDFYRFCGEIKGKEEFKGATIINPQKEEIGIVINVSNELKASMMPINEDSLDEIIYTKKKLGNSFQNKPYFVYVTM